MRRCRLRADWTPAFAGARTGSLLEAFAGRSDSSLAIKSLLVSRSALYDHVKI